MSFGDDPSDGRSLFKGKAGAAEVIITHNQSRYFSNVLGSGMLAVTAWDVARGTYTPASPGILILDATDNNTLKATLPATSL